MNNAQAIAQAIAAQAHPRINADTREVWTEVLRRIMRDAPSGSGIDAGVELEPCTPDCLKFSVSFHHMNEHGMYDGWTGHMVTVRPSFLHGIDLHIGGRDRNGIKDYLADVLGAWLTSEAPADANYADARAAA